jgi:hypothetical protein
MIDLSRAMYCIETMKKRGTFRGERIGIVVDTVSGEVAGYRSGQVVLFRRDMFPTDGQLRMGEYMGQEQKPTGTLTIETPMIQEEIEKQRGSGLTTWGAMINVPERYIEEVNM